MKLKRTAIIAVLLVYSTIGMAQTIIPDSISSPIQLNEVQISTNKEAESIKRITQEVEIIGKKTIEAAQAQSTADLLSKTANVLVQKSQQGGGSPVLRGFEASRIIIVIDGVKMNNLIYRSGHLQNIVTTDNNILDRVEVLFGPSSTTYGSDALGGVIHLMTKNPRLSSNDSMLMKVNAFTRFGTVNNEATGHVDFNIGTKKFGSLTSISYSSFGDLKGGKRSNPFYKTSYGERPFYAERINGADSLVTNSDPFLQVPSGFQQYDLLQKFSFKQNDHITHGINLQFSNSNDVPRYDRLTDPKGSGLNYAEYYYGPQTRFLAAYDFNRININSFFQKIHIGANYQSIEESRHSRKFGNNNLDNRIENVNVIGLTADIHRTVGSNTVRLGFDSQFNTLKSTANRENINTGDQTSLDTRYPDGNNTMNNIAIYYSHTWEINEKMILTDGVRVGYTTLQSTFNDTTFFKFPYSEVNQTTPVLSGSIGFIYAPTVDWKLSFLVSTGYRTPNVDDLSKIFESAPGVIILPNEDIKPEQTITPEIGITKIFNDKTRWSNTFYYTFYNDAILTDKYQYEGLDSIEYDGEISAVYANQNLGKAYIYGFSSTMTSEISKKFNCSIMLNYTYGRIKTDSSDAPLDHIPPFLARLQVNYTNKSFTAGLYFNYNAWKKLKDYSASGEDNLQYATSEGMPAWFTANVVTSYRINKFFTVQAGVENIMDTQYRVFASGINGAGRNIYGALRFTY